MGEVSLNNKTSNNNTNNIQNKNSMEIDVEMKRRGKEDNLTEKLENDGQKVFKK